MSLMDDVNKGREEYRKRQQKRIQVQNGRNKHKQPNRLLYGIGTLMEQFLPKKKEVVSGGGEKRENPYLDVIKEDLSGLKERLIGLIPERENKKNGYDPLYEAWKRGRGG